MLFRNFVFEPKTKQTITVYSLLGYDETVLWLLDLVVYQCNLLSYHYWHLKFISRSLRILRVLPLRLQMNSIGFLISLEFTPLIKESHHMLEILLKLVLKEFKQ